MYRQGKIAPCTPIFHLTSYSGSLPTLLSPAHTLLTISPPPPSPPPSDAAAVRPSRAPVSGGGRAGRPADHGPPPFRPGAASERQLHRHARPLGSPHRRRQRERRDCRDAAQIRGGHHRWVRGTREVEREYQTSHEGRLERPRDVPRGVLSRSTRAGGGVRLYGGEGVRWGWWGGGGGEAAAVQNLSLVLPGSLF